MLNKSNMTTFFVTGMSTAERMRLRDREYEFRTDISAKKQFPKGTFEHERFQRLSKQSIQSLGRLMIALNSAAKARGFAPIVDEFIPREDLQKIQNLCEEVSEWAASFGIATA